MVGGRGAAAVRDARQAAWRRAVRRGIFGRFEGGGRTGAYRPRAPARDRGVFKKGQRGQRDIATPGQGGSWPAAKVRRATQG